MNIIKPVFVHFDSIMQLSSCSSEHVDQAHIYLKGRDSYCLLTPLMRLKDRKCLFIDWLIH